MKSFERIDLNKELPIPIYIQLTEKIKDMMAKGELKADDRLPPIRKLATSLGINNITVVSAYELLEKEGFVYKKIGSGTFVAPTNFISVQETGWFDPVNEDFKRMDRGQIQVKENMISFASATPTPDLFPVEDFRILLNEVLDRDGGNAFGYQDSQGYYPLRESLVSYLKSYGIYCTPEKVQIISGAQQGIDVITKAFLSFGDTVIVESPTYAGAIATFRSRGTKIIDVPLLEDGMDLNCLEEKIKLHRPKLIYVMPNFQNPTGYSYSLEKKKKLLEIAYKYDVLVVEDDYLSELGFYSEEHSTLKSLDHRDEVIYIKSFSKIFMPGLRLGFLVIPESKFDRILAAKHASDISTSGLNQRAFDLYLRKGIWKQHIRFMEGIYKERFDIMKNCLEQYIDHSSLEYKLPKGGLNFWLKLPAQYSSNEFYIECAKQNILIVPGSIFFAHEKESPYFRMSIASVYPKQIQMGVQILSETIGKYVGKSMNHVSYVDSYTPLL